MGSGRGNATLCGSPWTVWVWDHVQPPLIGTRVGVANLKAGDGSV